MRQPTLLGLLPPVILEENVYGYVVHVFIDQMPFMLSYKQCQSTETNVHITDGW